MGRKPSVTDCLDEIRRLRAENERLERLVKTQRPELEKLRGLATAVRDLAFSLPLQLEHMRELSQELIGSNDDLPTFDELRGCISSGAERIEKALGRG